MNDENNTINIDAKVNKEEVEDTITELKEVADVKPNITIRNNKNVYVTINYFNETEQEWSREVE